MRGSTGGRVLLLTGALLVSGCGQSPTVGSVGGTPSEPPSTSPAAELDSAAAFVMQDKGWTAEHAAHAVDVQSALNGTVSDAALQRVVGASYAGFFYDADTLVPVVASTEPADAVRDRLLRSDLFASPDLAEAAHDLTTRQVTYDLEELRSARRSYQQLRAQVTDGPVDYLLTGIDVARNRVRLTYDPSEQRTPARDRLLDRARQDGRVVLEAASHAPTLVADD